MCKGCKEIKRYAVGYYNHDKRMNEEGWWNSPGNRLVTYIYDEQDKFDIKYICSDEEKNRYWFIIDPQELNKAKEYFTTSEDVTEVIDWIDTCNDYDKWKTSCIYCDSISINLIPYTYRTFGGSTGREYNCPMCSGLNNRTAYKIAEEKRVNGLESAINLIIDISEGTYTDEEEKYYCKCCEVDIRKYGIVEDGKYVYVPNYNLEIVKSTVEEYNKREEEYSQEVEGYYPHYFEDKTRYNCDVNGFRCFECNQEVREDVVEELLSVKNI